MEVLVYGDRKIYGDLWEVDTKEMGGPWITTGLPFV